MQNGKLGTQDWRMDDKYLKLRDFAREALAELDGADEEGEEEYYDEEDEQ